jgi:hypothetical protein
MHSSSVDTRIGSSISSEEDSDSVIFWLTFIDFEANTCILATVLLHALAVLDF